MGKLLSIVIPCFNEEKTVQELYREIYFLGDRLKGLMDILLEFIFIDDGSTDSTLGILRNLSERDGRVRYLSFSRNFGKEAGIYAGLEHSKGDWVAIMDADMQDPPKMLEEMCEILAKGEYDCVAARRVSREGEPPVRSFFSRQFYPVMNRIAHLDMPDGMRDFRMMTRTVVDAVLKMGEYHRFSKGIFSWIGFRTQWLPYPNTARLAGETKWTLWKLFRYSLEAIFSFSTVPLAISSVMGILLCLLSFFVIVFLVVRTLLFGDPVAGYPSMMCVILFVGGVQLLCMGILGQYLAKTYLESKHRPIYLIREQNREKE